MHWVSKVPAWLQALGDQFGTTREAVRRPWLIDRYMYSNQIRVTEVEAFNRHGILTLAPGTIFKFAFVQISYFAIGMGTLAAVFFMIVLA